MKKDLSEKSSGKSIVGIYTGIDPEATGDKIRELMKEGQYSVLKIAELCKCSPQAVYKWLRGYAMPSIETLNTLAEVLGTKAEDLVVYRTDVTGVSG